MKNAKKSRQHTTRPGNDARTRKLRRAAEMILAHYEIPPQENQIVPCLPVKGAVTNLDAAALWLENQLGGRKIHDPEVVARMYTKPFCLHLTIR